MLAPRVQAETSFQMIAKHLQTIPVPPSELARALALIDVSVRGAKKKLRGGGP